MRQNYPFTPVSATGNVEILSRKQFGRYWADAMPSFVAYVNALKAVIERMRFCVFGRSAGFVQ